MGRHLPCQAGLELRLSMSVHLAVVLRLDLLVAPAHTFSLSGPSRLLRSPLG